MTTIALNCSTKILEGSLNVVKKILHGMMIGWMISRQTQANKAVAEQISKYEHNGENYWDILNELNAKTIAGIEKEFKR